jgi:uncharacterized membrane protein YhaH (DUF805 family)
MTFFQGLFGFTGRIPRLPFFGYSLLVVSLALVITMGGGALIDVVGETLGGGMIVAGLVVTGWAGLALATKRLHDMGVESTHANWLYGLNLSGGLFGETAPALAILSALVFLGLTLWLLLGAGQSHANQYGSVPRAVGG